MSPAEAPVARYDDELAAARSTGVLSPRPGTRYAAPESRRPFASAKGAPTNTSATPSPVRSGVPATLARTSFEAAPSIRYPAVPSPARSMPAVEAWPRTTYTEPEFERPLLSALGAPTRTAPPADDT